MRRPEEDLIEDERLSEIAQILALGELRLQQHAVPLTTIAQISADENPPDFSIPVREPRPGPSLIH